MAGSKVPPTSGVSELAGLLDSPEIARLVAELDGTRWTGRPGYPIRAMVGMALVKSLYAIPTWSRTARLVAEHPALQAALGCAPSVYACYRFTAKLRAFAPLLDDCIARVVGSLSDADPDYGRDVAIDASDLPAYANGQRFVSKGGRERSDDEFSDPDASWGHRSAVSTRKGGGFYGYKLHAAVDAASDLPVAWVVETASEAEANVALTLLDMARERVAVETVAMDKGYDSGTIHDGCEDRDAADHPAPSDHRRRSRGRGLAPLRAWRVAVPGSDFKRGASKWRCPTGECKPASRWVKADRLHPLIPRETLRWRKLYRGRAAVEREFGRLKNEWALAPLRVRGLERVQLHADLTILAKLACALARARALPLAA